MRERDRPRGRAGRSAPLAAGLVVALLAGLALTVTHHTPRPPLPPAVAVRVALHDPRTRQALAGSHWKSVRADPIDGQVDRVSFWAGGQIVAEVAVQRDRQVLQAVDDRTASVPYGDWIAYQPAALAVLTVLFLLMTLVTPWRRMRNLDATSTLSLLISVVLFQHRYVDASMVLGAVGLAYLTVRCAWTAFAGTTRAGTASTPLLSVLAAGSDPARRVRWLRVALGVLACVYVMVGLSSPIAVDVTYAVMEGATKLIHGVLPYGHMPSGIIHSDTYPILSYALYVPLALLSPVRSLWDSVDIALGLAVVAALLAAWGAFRCASRTRPGRGATRPPADEEAGLRTALAVLAFPSVLITTSTGTTDVVLAAMLAAAVLLWRRPGAGAAVLAAAGWFKLAPFALLPVFLAPLRGRRLAVALGAVLAVSLPLLGLLVALGGIHGPAEMLHAVSYQFTRGGSLQSVWGALGIQSLQPVAESCVLGLIAGAVVRLWGAPQLAGDRMRMAALTAAILIGLQLAADYWAFLYLVWFVPLVCVSLFEPGLASAARVVNAPAPVAAPVRGALAA